MASVKSDFAKPILIPLKARSWPLARLRLSVRLDHVLGNMGCERLGDIHGLTYEQIGEAKSCGQKTLDELQLLVTRLCSGDPIVLALKNSGDNKEKSRHAQLFIPQHARGLRVEILPMSVRLTNVLERMNIRLLGDLHGVSLEKVRDTKNCGWRTVSELEGLVHRAQAGELLDVEEALIEAPAPINLARILDKAMDELPTRSRDFLLLYMRGTGNAPLTLEEIGAQYKLTRERVRQVMEKAFRQISKGGGSLASELSESIADQCFTAVHPLTPELLTQWLGAERVAACRYPISFYIRLLGKLAPALPAWPDGQKSGGIAVGRQAEISRHLKMILSDNAAPLPLDVALTRLKAVNELVDLEADEFLKALRRSSSLIVEFLPPDKFEVRLAKFRTRDWARQVLSQAERPLTPEEMIERGHQMFGDAFLPVTSFTLANVLKPEDGFYLLAPRAIGLRQHMRLPQERFPAVAADFYHLLRQQNRPVSTWEAINEHLIEAASLINAYELAQILLEDRRFINLGRFLFALEEWGIEEREHVYDLVPKVLAQAGHPVTVNELSAALRRFRSMSTTSMPTLLHRHTDVCDYGFGYYGLRSWGDEAKKYLASKAHFVNRLIARSEPPMTFGDVCRILKIESHGELADRLWRTAKALPKVAIKPLQQTPDTLLIHKNWSLLRALRSVLANAERPLPAYEIQWELNERFRQTFGDKSVAEVERCLQQNNLFMRNVQGEYLLNKHLERDETETFNIRQACLEILSSENRIIDSDDLIERLATEAVEVENLSPDILATLLRDDEAFEEIGSNRFRVKL